MSRKCDSNSNTSFGKNHYQSLSCRVTKEVLRPARKPQQNNQPDFTDPVVSKSVG